MISVQNHLQPLNGNKSWLPHLLLLLVVACFCFSSCDALKKVPRQEVPTGEEELDEIKGTRVYNPQTGKWEVSTEVTGTMDTVAWNEPVGETAPPITSEVPDAGNTDSGESIMKDVYNVAVMLPFMTNKFQELDSKINSKSDLAINLYGGIRMAFDDLSGKGIKLNVTVHDTQASESVTKSLLEEETVTGADLIVGPISKNNLKLVAEFAKVNRKPMVSPLSPSTTITKENPYYLQVSPGLEAHCKAITEHALSKYPAEQLVLVCRNKKAETKRLKYFQDGNRAFAGTSDVDRLKEFIVTDLSADFNEMDVSPYIIPGKTTVFIVPSWSNESFIYTLLREISVKKGRNKVVVYGMPQWMKYEQISYDYYERLSLHISSDTDINSGSDEIERFRRNYFQKYGTPPSEYSYVGYDVMNYFGSQLFDSGTQFQKTMDKNGKDMLHTRFAFDPIAPKDPVGEDYSKVERYENRYVNILKFENYFFQLVD